MDGVRSRPCLRNRDLAGLGCGFEHESARHRTARDLFGVTATLSRRCRSCRRHRRYLRLQGRIHKCGVLHALLIAGWRSRPPRRPDGKLTSAQCGASFDTGSRNQSPPGSAVWRLSYGRVCRLLGTGKGRTDIYRVSQPDIIKFSIPDPHRAEQPLGRPAQDIFIPNLRLPTSSQARLLKGSRSSRATSLKGSCAAIGLARRPPDGSNTEPR